MKTLTKMAWRNIWRNRRRTLITMSSVLFAVLLAVYMRSFQIGSYDHMINNVVEANTGYIQIHSKGYWDDRNINDAFGYTQGMKDTLMGIDNVELVIPRLSSFALASFEKRKNKSKGAMIIGVEPGIEDQMTGLSKKVVEGEYLKDGESGALVGSKLADYLELGVGDSIVILGQGYHGATAAGLIEVKGIVEFPLPEMNRSFIYTDIETAMQVFRTQEKITALAFLIKNKTRLEETTKTIRADVDTAKYEVMNWREMNPELVQQIESDNASGIIMLIVLYIIIAFGVFGTLLMMIAERKREFGVMIAIGMKKMKIILMVVTEMLFIGLMGAIGGIILAMPFVYLAHVNPIQLSGDLATAMESYGVEPVMPTAWRADIFLYQMLTVVVIVALASIYPVLSIFRIKVMKALRN